MLSNLITPTPPLISTQQSSCITTIGTTTAIKDSNTATVFISSNTLTAASLTHLSITVSTPTSYNFSLTINNPLGSGAGVRITMPSTISIATGTCLATVYPISSKCLIISNYMFSIRCSNNLGIKYQQCCNSIRNSDKKRSSKYK